MSSNDRLCTKTYQNFDNYINGLHVPHESGHKGRNTAQHHGRSVPICDERTKITTLHVEKRHFRRCTDPRHDEYEY